MRGFLKRLFGLEAQAPEYAPPTDPMSTWEKHERNLGIRLLGHIKHYVEDNNGYDDDGNLIHKGTYKMVPQETDLAQCRAWLEDGASPNERTADGDTALAWAVFMKKKEVISLLLDYGAETGLTCKDGKSAFDYADPVTRHMLRDAEENPSDNRRRNLGKILLYELGDDTPDAERCKRLIKSGAAVDYPGKDGHTSLMLAGYRDMPDVFQLLLDHGANVKAVTKDGKTAVDFITGACREILKKYTGPDSRPDTGRGNTP